MTLAVHPAKTPGTAVDAARGPPASRGRGQHRRQRRPKHRPAADAQAQNSRKAEMAEILDRRPIANEPASQLQASHVVRSAAQVQNHAASAAKQRVLIDALWSLYKDRVEPLDHHVRRRIEESTKNRWTPDELVEVLQQTPGIYVKELTGRSKRWLYLEEEDGNFVDATSADDPFPEFLWYAVREFVNSSAQSWDTLPLSSSRYDLARILHERIPALKRYALGEACHVVQLAVRKHCILGYRDGQIVPYHKSLDFEKRKHAEQCQPTGKHESDLCVQEWERAQVMLKELMEDPEHASGLPLSSLKSVFRSRYDCELDETAFGHTKLSALIKDPHFLRACRVEANGAEMYVYRADTSGNHGRDETLFRTCQAVRQGPLASNLRMANKPERRERRKWTKQIRNPVAEETTRTGISQATVCFPEIVPVPWRQHVRNTFIHVQNQDQHGRGRREQSAPPQLLGASLGACSRDSEECGFSPRKTRSASPVCPTDEASPTHPRSVDPHMSPKLPTVPAG